MENKTAVIYGITGQDSSYLSELLLAKNYKVIGVKRRTSTNNLQNLESAGVLNNPNFKLIEGDLCDSGSITNIISTYKPDECYNLAAQSHVATSFDQPSYTFEVNAKGPLLILEAIRLYSPQTKFYQASTSEMFGHNYSTRNTGEFKGMLSTNSFGYDDWPGCIEKFQDENTSLSPNSPYGVAKTAAHHLVRLYRESYSVFVCAGILFNHESERRGENFVTRKITKYIGKLFQFYKSQEGYKPVGIRESNGEIEYEFPTLKLGNIDAIRDWGHAEDYVHAMWLMLQQEKPDDYIIGTGEAHSVKDFLEEAFSKVQLKWNEWVEIDPVLYRPCEVPYLRCDASKAKNVLGWTPKVTFKELVQRMVEADINGKK